MSDVHRRRYSPEFKRKVSSCLATLAGRCARSRRSLAWRAISSARGAKLREIDVGRHDGLTTDERVEL